MKNKITLLRITTLLSILLGIFFCFLLSVTTQENHLQYGLLGFIIGFPIAWLIYLSVWFISKGVTRTAFPSQSAFIVNGLQQLFNIKFTDYQEKMLVELTGTLIMIVVALVLAGAAFMLVSGVLYIVGRLSW